MSIRERFHRKQLIDRKRTIIRLNQNHKEVDYQMIIKMTNENVTDANKFKAVKNMN